MNLNKKTKFIGIDKIKLFAKIVRYFYFQIWYIHNHQFLILLEKNCKVAKIIQQKSFLKNIFVNSTTN